MAVNKKALFYVLLSVLFIGLSGYMHGYNPLLDNRLLPYDGVHMPAPTEEFSEYVAHNRALIRAALVDLGYGSDRAANLTPYTLEELVDMRAPFELSEAGATCISSQAGAGKGFLLIHGLSDSPYLLRSVAQSLSEAFPCALIRSLLTPGHGTVPGALLTVDRADWQQITTYGVNSFRQQVDELYVVGYSNGAALILDYLDNNRTEDLVQGLVFLSPGLRAINPQIVLAPYVKYFLHWVSRGEDTDAVKYESFATNAAAEFHLLTRRLLSESFSAIETPTLMVVSGDDSTIDAATTVDFFCDRIQSSRKTLLWYRSPVTETSPARNCSGIEVLNVESDLDRFVSHSHVSISIPVTDPHYGLDSNYSQCLGYNEDPALFTACLEDDDNTVYAEYTVRDSNGLYENKLVRRATFNPLYPEMITRISCFVNVEC